MHLPHVMQVDLVPVQICLYLSFGIDRAIGLREKEKRKDLVWHMVKNNETH